MIADDVAAGGVATDSGSAIVLDGSGNMVIGGYSASSDFPTTVGAYDQTANSSNDVTVTKLAGLWGQRAEAPPGASE